MSFIYRGVPDFVNDHSVTRYAFILAWPIICQLYACVLTDSCVVQISKIGRAARASVCMMELYVDLDQQSSVFALTNTIIF